MLEMHEARAEHLEAVFTRIHKGRMDGIPILNQRLEVEAVGTREWNGHVLLALITPWFINLMLLPVTDEQKAAWTSLPLGSNAQHRFPAGRFEFIVGEEADIGRYQMCSLFSPVLEFEDHAAARLAATAALEALFDAALDPAVANQQKAETASKEPVAASEKHAPVNPSRRGLITGRIAPREGSV